MSINEPIVRTSFVATGAEGERRGVTVEVGKPYQCGPAEWACSIGLDGLYANLHDIHAGDSLQAICLALRFVLQLLAWFQEDGGKLENPEGGDVSLDMYFFTPLPNREAQ